MYVRMSVCINVCSLFVSVCLFVCLPVCAISAVDLTMTAAAFRDLPQVLVASVEALQRSLKRA